MASLKKEIAKGVFWIALAKYSGIIINLIITAILARLISPQDFGTIAIAMVILNFLQIFSDIGFGTAIVQFKDLTKRDLSSIFTLTCYVGMLLSAILYFSADILSDYYKNNELAIIVQLLSFVIIFYSLNIVPNSLMRRDKRFKTIAIRTLSFQIISGLFAVWAAFNGWGIYALLVNPMITAIGVFIVNYLNYPQHFLIRMDSQVFQRILSYSGFQFAFSFMNYFSRNLDKLIIGRFFSMEKLGYYDKSYHFMILPLQNITFVIEPVLHPILSSLKNDKTELCKKNEKLAQLLSYISFPVGLIMFFCGSELIHIVYGNQWDAAVPVFRILSLSLPLQMILSTSGAIYQAAGKTNHMFYVGVMNTICTISGFLIAAFFGKTIEAMAWAWVITLIVNFVNSYMFMHFQTLKESPKHFYLQFLPQLINSIVVFLVLYVCTRFVCVVNVFLSLVIKSIIIIFLTVILGVLFHQYSIKDILSIRNIRRNR